MSFAQVVAEMLRNDYRRQMGLIAVFQPLLDKRLFKSNNTVAGQFISSMKDADGYDRAKHGYFYSFAFKKWREMPEEERAVFLDVQRKRPNQ